MIRATGASPNRLWRRACARRGRRRARPHGPIRKPASHGEFVAVAGTVRARRPTLPRLRRAAWSARRRAARRSRPSVARARAARSRSTTSRHGPASDRPLARKAPAAQICGRHWRPRLRGGRAILGSSCATPMKFSGWPRRPAPAKSSRPFASWPRSTIPTRARSRGRKIDSRKSGPPTRFSATPRSAAPMTAAKSTPKASRARRSSKASASAGARARIPARADFRHFGFDFGGGEPGSAAAAARSIPTSLPSCSAGARAAAVAPAAAARTSPLR